MANPLYYVISTGVIFGCMSIILLLNTNPLVDKTGYTILTQASGLTGFSSLAVAFFAVLFSGLRKNYAPYKLGELTSEEMQRLKEVFPNPDKEYSKVVTKGKNTEAYLIFTRAENVLIASPKLVEAEYKDVGPIIRDTLFDTAATLNEDIIIKTDDKEVFKSMGFLTYKNPNILIAPCPKTLVNLLNSRFEKGFSNYVSILAKKKLAEYEIKKMKEKIASSIHKENKRYMKLLYKELLYRNAFLGLTRKQTEEKTYQFFRGLTESSFEKALSSVFKQA